MPVRMELSRILIREMADVQIIELTEVGGDRSFPIVIGLPEAFAIDRRQKEIPVARPQTHDLLAATIRELGGELREIHISDLAEGVFYARLVVDQNGRTLEIDARPSDAIALGVAEAVPIFVAEHVLEQAAADAAESLGGALGGGEEDDEEDDLPSFGDEDGPSEEDPPEGESRGW